MRHLGWIIGSLGILLSGTSTVSANESSRATKNTAPIYADLTGEVALENDRVLVQRFTIQPGVSTGHHAYPAHQLVVFIKGGVLTSKAGRSTLWPDGRVEWLEHAGQDDGSTNTGRTPIELLWVSLKPVLSVARREPKFGYLSYPNIPGEDVLENDDLIVQRFKMNPGEWEGVHAHNPNTFYIFIKGGQWVSKSKEHPEGVAGSAPDGAIAWMDTIDISAQHQSGNTGKTSSEVVWVALKR
jgi:quercetin dioxygenase-like cupin family protein